MVGQGRAVAAPLEMAGDLAGAPLEAALDVGGACIPLEMVVAPLEVQSWGVQWTEGAMGSGGFCGWHPWKRHIVMEDGMEHSDDC